MPFTKTNLIDGLTATHEAVVNGIIFFQSAADDVVAGVQMKIAEIMAMGGPIV